MCSKDPTYVVFSESLFLIEVSNICSVVWMKTRTCNRHGHLGSLTAANWVSFDFNVSYSSC